MGWFHPTDLVAIGSPHASLGECQAFAEALAGRGVRISTIVTVGRQVIADAAMGLILFNLAGGSRYLVEGHSMEFALPSWQPLPAPGPSDTTKRAALSATASRTVRCRQWSTGPA